MCFVGQDTATSAVRGATSIQPTGLSGTSTGNRHLSIMNAIAEVSVCGFRETVVLQGYTQEVVGVSIVWKSHFWCICTESLGTDKALGQTFMPVSIIGLVPEVSCEDAHRAGLLRSPD